MLVKIILGTEIHVFSQPTASLKELHAFINKMFKNVPKSFKLLYLDEEKDIITISSDEDVNSFAASTNNSRIFIEDSEQTDFSHILKTNGGQKEEKRDKITDSYRQKTIKVCNNENCNYIQTGIVDGYCCYGCQKNKGAMHGPKCKGIQLSNDTSESSGTEEPRCKGLKHGDDCKETQDTQDSERITVESGQLPLLYIDEDLIDSKRQKSMKACSNENCHYIQTGVVDGYCCKAC